MTTTILVCFPHYWLVIISFCFRVTEKPRSFPFLFIRRHIKLIYQISHCCFQKINESRPEFCDNLRGHSEKFPQVYRVFPPSPAGPGFPRKQNTQIVKNRESTNTQTHTKLNLYNLSLTCRRYALRPAESDGSRCKSISISTSL